MVSDAYSNCGDEALNIEGHTPWFLTELTKAGITIDYIHHEIARDEYLEESQRSVGPMLKLYTQIEFYAVGRQRTAPAMADQPAAGAIRVCRLGASGGAGLLGLAWGLLKVDTWTKGYYTKRLFIGVPLAVLERSACTRGFVEMGFDLPH